MWRTAWPAGAADVGDDYFAGHCARFGELQERGCRSVVRRGDKAVVNVAEELPVGAAARAAGVTRPAWARLGGRPTRPSGRVRGVWSGLAAGGALRLVTNVAPADWGADEVGRRYRRRWPSECFFRWLNCLLGCRPWLAERARGVTMPL